MTQLRKRATAVLVGVALALSACSTDPAADPTSSGLVPITATPSVVTPSGSGSTKVSPPSGSSQPSVASSTSTTPPAPSTPTSKPSSTAPSTTPSTARPPSSTSQSTKPPTSKPPTSTSRITAGGIPAADRTEIAAAWAGFWDLRRYLGLKPAAFIASKAKEFSRGYEYDGMVEAAEKYLKANVATYGKIKSRISWGSLTGNEAVIRDCMDQSQWGLYDTKTNKASTIGTSRVNLNATFVRADDGWKLSMIYSPKGESC